MICYSDATITIRQLQINISHQIRLAIWPQGSAISFVIRFYLILIDIKILLNVTQFKVQLLKPNNSYICMAPLPYFLCRVHTTWKWKCRHQQKGIHALLFCMELTEPQSCRASKQTVDLTAVGVGGPCAFPQVLLLGYFCIVVRIQSIAICKDTSQSYTAYPPPTVHTSCFPQWWSCVDPNCSQRDKWRTYGVLARVAPETQPQRACLFHTTGTPLI